MAQTKNTPTPITPVCQKWFDNNNIKKDQDCSINCAISGVDMGTFFCTSECDQLCQSKKTNDITIYALRRIFPKLTDAELKLIKDAPLIMKKAYDLSKQAQDVCHEMYYNSLRNDESDACRHFMWAGLLNKNLEKEMAQKVLNAHEANPEQPNKEKVMDDTNNTLGLKASSKLISQNIFTIPALKQEFNRSLLKKQLHIIKVIDTNKRPPPKEESNRK